ncbi:hypothetical protein FCM35_KLT07762 [Carex littledalei]|uniref:CFA20 domain-containing protein n=1 Tax=Carex littledalei TaxID=544730 RepID=A0A833VLA7_9POAL|nr:hypothetical protein FCM35_KLT07762 [Carex littledalei]
MSYDPPPPPGYGQPYAPPYGSPPPPYGAPPPPPPHHHHHHQHHNYPPHQYPPPPPPQGYQGYFNECDYPPPPPHHHHHHHQDHDGCFSFLRGWSALFIYSTIYSEADRSKPLQIWDKEVSEGHVKRLQDDDIQSNVLEILGANLQSTYITCPADPTATLGIKLPFLVLIVKNLSKYFTFEVQVLDDRNVRRRFRASNFQSVTRVKPFICTMPLKMEDGWNNIQLNLSDLTRRAYGTNYVETLRVQVHANCRLRRIYFSDRLYSDEELPPEFKLYLPVQVPGTYQLKELPFD